MVDVDEATTLRTGTPPVPEETPAPTEPPARPAGPVVHRIRRRRQGSVIAGVTGGVADHLGVDVLRVRLVFVLLVAAAGAGFVAYAALWLFCPIEPRGVQRA